MRLRYYPDDRPGIMRRRQGRGFSYWDVDGTRIDCPKMRAQIEALAIPPAYQDVWISPIANGHLRATGRDEKGRKQYVYHEKWSAARETEKYDTLADVGVALPRLRRWIGNSMTLGIEQKQAAIAIGLALVERGSLRPGSPLYTRENASYGVTTLLPSHFRKDGNVSVLSYAAKGGKKVEKRLLGKRLSDILSFRKGQKTKRLIMWHGDGSSPKPIHPSCLNASLTNICGADMTVKAIRTWNGTLAAFRAAHTPEKLSKKMLSGAASRVLHNTPAIAQKSYIHPAVMELAEISQTARQKLLSRHAAQQLSDLRAGEAALIDFLQEY